MTDLQTSKFRVVDKEEYYTRPVDAHRLYDEVIRRYGTDFDFFIEPSCGMGAFLNLMPPNKKGIDIIFGVDFFEWEFPKGKNIAIGNPPFGRKGKIAMKFLNRCAEHCDVVAMVLPSIFSKFTFINRVHTNMHLMYETPVTEFVTPSGKPYFVNCVFQIWQKNPNVRPKIIKLNRCSHFDMIHRHISRTTDEELERLKKEYDFTIAQIEGKVNGCDVTKGSHFFIKDNTPDKCVRDIMERLDYEGNRRYHIGAISLTRADVVERFLMEFSKRTEP